MADQDDLNLGGRPLTDIEVARFLADFRDRPKADQEASPVMEELRGFPQWVGAQYADDPAPTRIPPDPRLSGAARRAAAEEQPPAAPVQVTQRPDGARSMTTADAGRPSNPWADVKPPPDDGSGAFVGLNTDVRPPFRGSWRRVERGWFRDPGEAK